MLLFLFFISNSFIKRTNFRHILAVFYMCDVRQRKLHQGNTSR